MRAVGLSIALLCCPLLLAAQQHDHQARMAAAGSTPTESGQAGFATIAEIVAILQADPSTDWSRVDIEALRAHLRDMDDVTLRAEVTAQPVANGMRFDVTGTGRAVGAIRRLVEAHAHVLADMPEWEANATRIPGGVRLVVTSAAPGLRGQIRGLGFIGMLTQGAHHTTHHLAIARGSDPHAGHGQ